MTVIDHIDVSSDEEPVQQDHITTQRLVPLHARQAMFVESDDIIDLSSDEETVQQDNIATRPTATSLDRQIVFDVADDGRQGVQGLQDVFVETGEVRKEATKSGGNVKAAASSTVAKKGPLDTTATQTCPPTAVQLPSPASTTPKTTIFEGNDGNVPRVKVRRPRKNYHTETPKRSPRLGEKRNGSNKSAIQIALDRKMYLMLEPVEDSTASTSNTEYSKTLSTVLLGREILSGPLKGRFRGRRWRRSNKSVEESAASTSNANLPKPSLLAPQTNVVD